MKLKAEGIEALEEREELFKEMIESGQFNFIENRRTSGGNFKHPLQEILLVWFCGIICGFTTYETMEWNAQRKISFFRKFFPYKHGAPSRATIARLIGLIDTENMQNLLLATVSNSINEEHISENTLQTIAIDGKTHCGLRLTEENKTKLHLVSAFDTQQGITLTQEMVPEKANEIIAIKNILSMLSIEGRTITIDAIGTQKEITKLIRSRKANYILALKKNQKTLFDAVESHFADKDKQVELKHHEEFDKGHGRIEKRTIYAAKTDWFKGEEWVDLNTIVMVKTESTSGKQTTSCIRYFITNLPPEPEKLLKGIRSHWSIESMHWTLDVTFNEDDRILWNKVVAHNEAIARRIAMNMLKKFRETFRIRAKKEKVAYHFLQKIMLCDDSVLESLLRETFK